MFDALEWPGRPHMKIMLPQVRKSVLEKVIESRFYMFGAPAWPGRPHMKMMLPPVRRNVQREVSNGSCYRKSSLHVWCTGMTGQAAHEDDAAPVEANHGGQELSQAPHLAHQVHLPRIIVNMLAKNCAE